VTVNELALFAGAGGGILGGHLLGWRTVCAVECDAYAAAVLAQRQNDGFLEPFPVWSDVCSFDGRPWQGIVDVVSGGFPCQDISVAGKGAGIEGERSGLWGEFARIIREVRPRFVFVENSPALTFRGLGTVLGDLAALGYDAEWGVLGADDVGAPHRRKRIWILAHAAGERPYRHGQHFRATEGGGESFNTEAGTGGERPEVLADANRRRLHRVRPDAEDGREVPAQGIERVIRRGDGGEDVADANGEGSTGLHLGAGEEYSISFGRGEYVSDSEREGLEGQRGIAGKPQKPELGDNGASDAPVADAEDGRDVRRIRSMGDAECGDDTGGSEVDGRGQWWAVEPDVGRVANGVAARVDRLRCIGNGQVPAVAALAFSTLRERLEK
jgi:DNA (cytosine-5)-methyltransferase 1